MKFNFISGVLAAILMGITGYIVGYSDGKCAGINWLAKEHSIAAQCK